MGIDRQAAAGLIRLSRIMNGSLGRVCMLGRQVMMLKKEDVEYLSRAYGVPESIFDGTYADEVFLRHLRATSVTAIDFSDYERSERFEIYKWDLNQPIPQEIKGQFDVVFDGGTLEHVWNVHVSFCNARSLVRVGGRFLSYAPANGSPEHGFYQFGAEVWYRSFSSHFGFKMERLILAVKDAHGAKEQYFLVSDPANIKGRVGLLGSPERQHWLVIARKDQEVDSFSVPFPMQSDYESIWHGGVDVHHANTSNGRRGIRGALVSTVKAVIPRALVRRIQKSGHSNKLRDEAARGLIEISQV